MLAGLTRFLSTAAGDTPSSTFKRRLYPSQELPDAELLLDITNAASQAAGPNLGGVPCSCSWRCTSPRQAMQAARGRPSPRWRSNRGDAGSWVAWTAGRPENDMVRILSPVSLRGDGLSISPNASPTAPSGHKRKLTLHGPAEKPDLHHWTGEEEVTGQNSQFFLHHRLHLVGTPPRISGISLLLNIDWEWDGV